MQPLCIWYSWLAVEVILSWLQREFASCCSTYQNICKSFLQEGWKEQGWPLWISAAQLPEGSSVISLPGLGWSLDLRWMDCSFWLSLSHKTFQVSDAEPKPPALRWESVLSVSAQWPWVQQPYRSCGRRVLSSTKVSCPSPSHGSL